MMMIIKIPPPTPNNQIHQHLNLWRHYYSDQQTTNEIIVYIHIWSDIITSYEYIYIYIYIYIHSFIFLLAKSISPQIKSKNGAKKKIIQVYVYIYIYIYMYIHVYTRHHSSWLVKYFLRRQAGSVAVAYEKISYID